MEDRFQEEHPGRTSTIGSRMVMRRQNTTDDILINKDATSQGDLLGDARTSPTRITLFHFDLPLESDPDLALSVRVSLGSLRKTAAGISEEPERDANSTASTV